MIAGESFVYFGPEVWHGMWRNRHHLMTRLARTNKVVYVEPRPYVHQIAASLRRGESGLPDLWRERCMVQEQPNLWVYRPPRYAPLGGPPPVRAATHALRKGALRRELAVLGIERPIVWISTPTQFDARLDLPARLRVYHIVDDYLAYHDLAAALRESYVRRERQLIGWADLVVVVSPALLASKGAADQKSKFRLLPNGYDDVAYRDDRPAELPRKLAGLRRPVLGYVGLISVRLDLALLDWLSAAHPEWTLVLMGTVFRQGCEDALDRLVSRANVHLLPAVPGEQVADYVRSFDLGLLPYRVTQETVHASPLKLYEYLAAGLPVVAANVPGSQEFAQVVEIARTPEEWAAAIARQLADDSPERRATRCAAVAPHTWDARVQTLSGYLMDALESS
jgi:glycosyltransferase involved in cell wall biosynthesis